MKFELFSKLSVHAVAMVGLASSLIACSPESPKLVELPLVKKERVKNTGDNKVTFNRAVDILFVVDDSGSMAIHQQNLSKNIQAFTQGFMANQMLDFHIGSVTSSMESSWSSTTCYAFGGELFGCPKYVERSTPNGIAVLEKNLNPGTGGSGNEEFFSPIRSALSAPLVNGKNAGFYRQDAYLAVIFLTDSDDQSSESAQDIYNFLLNLKGGDAAKIITYGVYIPTNVSSCDRSGEPEPRKLEALFKIANGKTLGLCDADYGKKLAALGDDLVRRVGSVLYLTRPADPATITVAYGTQIIPNDPQTGWIYDPSRNALVFGPDIDLKPEPPGTQVEVDFIAAEY
ncbi:MAG: VWA domain-containing protein [Bdellovibrionaceae bacterium]|nr:VWA domain-containing protein [Pseudobdellovibrionaceae bacterium]